ncbi:IMPACT family protein [Methylogaea oryzae]|uniref:IMPACT family protein n=1 Tax=Methylogaea oryzae TaxID=1295382 RepID=UPI000B03D987|nr:YigZ family protein [Methylogaea oryzae]
MQRIAQPGRAEQTINKSRFIGAAEACADEREVMALFRRLAAEHPSAHHLAFAYRLKTPQGLLQRCHDAGEPSGTAGKPILQHLEGKDLVNACIAVVRYYGGINLGTGGLARAYGNTARMALEAARLEPYVEMAKLRLTVDYGRWDRWRGRWSGWAAGCWTKTSASG